MNERRYGEDDDADIVERAALASRTQRSPARRVAGLPVSVGRTVELGRAMDDAEWERFAADLRATFDAQGIVRSDGATRSWANGNLRVTVEPSTTGHRVRMLTVNARARTFMGMGTGFVALATVIAALDYTTAGMGLGAAIGQMGGVAAMGAGLFGYGALRLPGWARARERQMDEVIGRLGSRDE